MKSGGHRHLTEEEVTSLLREHGIQPTSQRIAITQTFLAQGSHLSADDLFRLVTASGSQVSKATVYNTLSVLAARGLVRAVIADPERVFYDPNVRPHHHFYDEATGELTDIEAVDLSVARLPPLPERTELRGVDVVIRVRRTGDAE